MTTSVPAPTLFSQLFAPYALLRGERNLALVLAANMITRIVQWLYLITLAILAFEISNSPGVVALLTLVRIVLNAGMLPVSGVLTDRIGARTLMLVSVGGRAVSMLGLLAVHSRGTLWVAFVSLAAASLFSAPFQTALMTLLPSVVDDRRLLDATSLITQVEFLTQGIGPIVGGVLILFGDIHLAFAVSAVAFAVTFGLLLLVHTPPVHIVEDEDEGSWLTRTLGGFLFLLREHDHVLAALSLALAGIGVINGANYTLIVVLSTDVFHFGGQGADFLNGIYGVGSLLGGLVIGPLVARKSIVPVFLGMAIVDCFASIFFGFSPASALPFFFMALGGLTDTATKVVALSIVQIAAPRVLFGRIFSAFESSLLGGQALGSLVVGPLVVLLGPRFATFWLSVVGLVGLAVTLPWLLRLERTFGVRIFLRNVPVLTRLAATVLDDLAARFALERFANRTEIVHEGDSGDRFYIVKQGHVDVIAQGDRPTPAHVATLSRMDYFGEIALLSNVPRTATVRAAGAVELYSLSRADFRQLLAQSEAFHDTVGSVSAAREADLRTKLLVGV
jgi:MFS family permease